MNKAIALEYREDLPAPFVSAKGKGVFAEKILELASRNDVPINTNADLVEPLFDLSVGSYIPEEYFEIVAEILAFVYTIRKESESEA